MLNKKYVAVIVLILIIIIASTGFLLAQPNDDEDCKVCGMPDCNMNHTSKVSKEECEVCGMPGCAMNHTNNSTNSSHMNMTS